MKITQAKETGSKTTRAGCPFPQSAIVRTNKENKQDSSGVMLALLKDGHLETSNDKPNIPAILVGQRHRLPRKRRLINEIFPYTVPTHDDGAEPSEGYELNRDTSTSSAGSESHSDERMFFMDDEGMDSEEVGSGSEITMDTGKEDIDDLHEAQWGEMDDGLLGAMMGLNLGGVPCYRNPEINGTPFVSPSSALVHPGFLRDRLPGDMECGENNDESTLYGWRG